MNNILYVYKSVYDKTNKEDRRIEAIQGVHLILCFFPRILKSLQPLPHQHSAAIGCTKNNQQIEVTVHSHCVEGLLQRCRRGRGCSEL